MGCHEEGEKENNRIEIEIGKQLTENGELDTGGKE
jgi:hypothetical protein